MRLRDSVSSDGLVDTDHALETLLSQWAMLQVSREVDLRKLFRAGDVDLNHVLTFDEFFTLMKGKYVRMPPDLTDEMLTVMYRRAIGLSGNGNEGIDVNSFVTVVQKFAMQIYSVESDSRSSRSVDESALVKKAYMDSVKTNVAYPSSEWHAEGSARGLVIPKSNSKQMLSLLDQAWRPYSNSMENTLTDLDGIAVPAPPSITKVGGRTKRSRTVTDMDVQKIRDQYDAVRTAITLAGDDTSMDQVNAAWIAFRRLLSEIYRLKTLACDRGYVDSAVDSAI